MEGDHSFVDEGPGGLGGGLQLQGNRAGIPEMNVFSLLSSAIACLAVAKSESIWMEGESPSRSKIAKHPWYHGEVKKDLLSGGEFLSHFTGDYPGTASYDFVVDEQAEFNLWVRANPVQSKMTMSLDGSVPQALDLSRRQTGNTNIASDEKPDLRFVAWSFAGKFELAPGKHEITFGFASDNSNHGSLDCFVFAADSFVPSSVLKPDEIDMQKEKLTEANEGWVPWLPERDDFSKALIDLRHLNEKVAGERGGIESRGADFVYRDTGEALRFWGVNGPPDSIHGDELRECARTLAKRGVNLVRLHGAVFDGKTGELDRSRVAHIQEVVAAMREEGIYSHISIYFPLWMTPASGAGWREGYDGKKHPFALLYFEPEFQKLYRSWLEAVIKQPDRQGKILADEPAVMGIELINEDSFFFWTFNEENVPAPQMKKLESRFAGWALKNYGSIEKVNAAWKGLKHPHDGPGRLGFRPLYQIFTEKSQRDQDTARFLMETQRAFYQETTDWLRAQGFRGLVTASNWHTANSKILGPLEKLSYMPGDFIDRHGYFGCRHQGDNAAWSVREGHTYWDRSALRFDPENQGKSPDFSHPVVDPCYNGKPSMISETTWNRPNRYRGEAPLFYATYGALQGTDAIVHFALDSSTWAVKPGFFMQPWTLMSPTQIGQFPAAALIYRLGLIREGELLADLSLSASDAAALKGSPLVQNANLDELRKSDVNGGVDSSVDADGIDPLIYYAGRTSLTVGETPKSDKIENLSRFINRPGKKVASSNGDVILDYGKGLLMLRAPAAQGALGTLKDGGEIKLPDMTIRSPLEVGEIVAVALDGKELGNSEMMLLQVMSEEKATGFQTELAGPGLKRITNIGTDPWLIRKLEGEVRFLRSDASELKVTALDANGRKVEEVGSAERIELLPSVSYYVIRK